MRVPVMIVYKRIVDRRTSLLAILLCALVSPCFAQRTNLLAARNAAKWLDSSAVKTKDGVVWPSDPRDPKSVTTTLYAGTPGPILFFLELYCATGRADYLRSARLGADALIASIPEQKEPGLYEGLAGIGFTLGQAYLITHDAKYRDGALR